ncbi:hypothetical protein LCGC14_0207830 [marine sediment metagenome]|uniref:Uncharacterized protein n=1 Tax=marine sediment metagenome TaxID=412755 RepID=A0A0F9UXS5_9ZZZZ
MRHKPIEIGEAMHLLGLNKNMSSKDKGKKLTPSQVARCRKEFFVEGTTLKALATHYKVSGVTMHNVVRRKGAYDTG